MDFADDLPQDSDEERFRKHNRFLRSLKEDITPSACATAQQKTMPARCIPGS